MSYNSYMRDDGKEYVPPDIFRAAVNDDPYELALSIRDGQSLLDREHRYSRTPLHLAAQHGSTEFIRAALGCDEFDVWMLDANNYTPYDLSARRNDREAQRMFFSHMYPE